MHGWDSTEQVSNIFKTFQNWIRNHQFNHQLNHQLNHQFSSESEAKQRQVQWKCSLALSPSSSEDWSAAAAWIWRGGARSDWGDLTDVPTWRPNGWAINGRWCGNNVEFPMEIPYLNQGLFQKLCFIRAKRFFVMVNSKQLLIPWLVFWCIYLTNLRCAVLKTWFVFPSNAAIDLLTGIYESMISIDIQYPVSSQYEMSNYQLTDDRGTPRMCV